MKVGVFGGTFDPPHFGHLIAAQDAHAELGLDRVLFVPARVPPHKQGWNLSAPEVRLRMIEQATCADERFLVSDVELKRTGPSYTADTLRELKTERPADELFLLLGVDQVREFATWHAPQAVLENARLVMLSREGIEQVAAGDAASDIVYTTVQVTRVDISSTLVRQRVRAGQPIRYLVPPAVEKIIADERLYTGSLG